MVQWWEARSSEVLHAREIVNGKANGAPLCNRSVVWMREAQTSPLVKRCGYCSYNAKNGGKAA